LKKETINVTHYDYNQFRYAIGIANGKFIQDIDGHTVSQIKGENHFHLLSGAYEG